MKELTIVKNIVTIDSKDLEISLSLPTNITAVQYHSTTGRCLEEPLMKEVPLSKYQAFIDEFNEIKNKVPTEEELAQIEEARQIEEAKQYLIDTDWIIIKINEAQLLGQDIQPLLNKYEVELLERENKRIAINSLEG